jgi:hypothetical protein
MGTRQVPASAWEPKVPAGRDDRAGPDRVLVAYPAVMT